MTLRCLGATRLSDSSVYLTLKHYGICIQYIYIYKLYFNTLYNNLYIVHNEHQLMNE